MRDIQIDVYISKKSVRFAVSNLVFFFWLLMESKILILLDNEND